MRIDVRLAKHTFRVWITCDICGDLGTVAGIRVDPRADTAAQIFNPLRGMGWRLRTHVARGIDGIADIEAACPSCAVDHAHEGGWT